MADFRKGTAAIVAVRRTEIKSPRTPRTILSYKSTMPYDAIAGTCRSAP